MKNSLDEWEFSDIAFQFHYSDSSVGRLRFLDVVDGFLRAVELVPMHLRRPHTTIKERSKHVRESAVERGRVNGIYRVFELVYRDKYAPGLG
jgi:hypothetical protein